MGITPCQLVNSYRSFEGSQGLNLHVSRRRRRPRRLESPSEPQISIHFYLVNVQLPKSTNFILRI